jgi:hypothetical protein
MAPRAAAGRGGPGGGRATHRVTKVIDVTLSPAPDARVIGLDPPPGVSSVARARDAAVMARRFARWRRRQRRGPHRDIAQARLVGMAGDVVDVLVPVDRVARPRASVVPAAQQAGDLGGGQQRPVRPGGCVDVANGAGERRIGQEPPFVSLDAGQRVELPPGRAAVVATEDARRFGAGQQRADVPGVGPDETERRRGQPRLDRRPCPAAVGAADSPLP